MCGSRKRGGKNVKLLKRGGKGKFCARRSEEEDNGREGRGLPPCPPLIFENKGDDSYGLK